MNVVKKKLVRVKGRRINNIVCMVYEGVDVYNRFWAGFYVGACAELSLYVDLHEDV